MNTNLTLKFGLTALIASVAMLGVACGDDDDASTTTTTSTTSSANGGGGNGGDATGGGGSGGGGDPTLDCATYCDLVTTNCAGDDEQYGDMASCMAVCATFDEGTNGTGATATGENTLGCRIYHGNVPAADEPTVHCTHAGPGGDGQCGSNCESFCAINEVVCGFGADANNQYADAAACMAACGMMATGDTYNGSNDVSSDANEFSCYLYHLTAASVDAATHCPHTNPGVMGPCGMPIP